MNCDVIASVLKMTCQTKRNLISTPEIYSWRRYSPSKTIWKAIITWIALLCFWFRKIASKMLISEVRLPLIEPSGYFRWNMFNHSQKICSFSRHEHTKVNTKIQNYLVTLLRFCFRITASKMLNFEICLPLKKTVGNYFDWNTSIHFQKLWS